MRKVNYVMRNTSFRNRESRLKCQPARNVRINNFVRFFLFLFGFRFNEANTRVPLVQFIYSSPIALSDRDRASASSIKSDTPDDV